MLCFHKAVVEGRQVWVFSAYTRAVQAAQCLTLAQAFLHLRLDYIHESLCSLSLDNPQKVFLQGVKC